MPHLRQVTLRRGPEPLIEDAQVKVSRGEKVGVVGPNGCGKSTLLALIRGEFAADAGEVELPADCVIASVAQQVPHSTAAVIDYLIDGDVELHSIERRLAQARAARDGLREAELLGEYEYAGGYTAQSWAAALLDGLGFDPGDVGRPLEESSGGRRMRASLARALMHRSDLLLLDEPTNHLDVEMRESLLLALQEFAGGVVIVSHDRALLRGVCNEFLSVAGGHVAAFDGDLENHARWLGRRDADQRGAPARPERVPAETATARPGADTGGVRERGAEAKRRAAARHAQLAPLRAISSPAHRPRAARAVPATRRGVPRDRGSRGAPAGAGQPAGSCTVRASNQPLGL